MGLVWQLRCRNSYIHHSNSLQYFGWPLQGSNVSDWFVPIECQLRLTPLFYSCMYIITFNREQHSD